MTLIWQWPWAGPTALAIAVILTAVTLYIVSRKTPPANSPRVFSLERDLKTESADRKFRQWRMLNRVALVMLLLALVSSMVLLSRPSQVSEADERASNRDIILCLDVSGSTLPYDREVIDAYLELVSSFEGERIGLSIFNSTSRMIFPLTDDYSLVSEQLTHASEILEDVQSQDDIDKMSPEDYQNISDWLEGTQNKKDATSLIGDGLIGCAAMLPGFADENGASTSKDDRTASIVLATDNVVSGTPTYTLAEAVSLASAGGITVDGLYSGPQESVDDETTQQMQSIIQSHGGLFLPRTGGTSVETLVDEINQRDENVSEQSRQAALVDAPGWWTLALAICILVWLFVAWRLKR